MKVMEFINAHREDEDGCECIILPDGTVEEPVPSHINLLIELAGGDSAALHKNMEKSMEPLFWLVEFTGCMSVWQTRVVSPMEPSARQLETLEILRDAAMLSPKYLLQKADEKYAESVRGARMGLQNEDAR